MIFGRVRRLGARVARGADRTWLLRGGLAALAVALAVVVGISFDGERDSGAVGSTGTGPPEPLAPRVVSADELGELAGAIGYPVYWAGEIDGRALRVEISDEGNVLVAYPPEGEAEDFPLAEALAIGSYPIADPAGAIAELAAEEGADIEITSDSGRVVLITDSSAYFADPDDRVQVEVYAPRPRHARRMALTDQVRPIE